MRRLLLMAAVLSGACGDDDPGPPRGPAVPRPFPADAGTVAVPPVAASCRASGYLSAPGADGLCDLTVEAVVSCGSEAQGPGTWLRIGYVTAAGSVTFADTTYACPLQSVAWTFPGVDCAGTYAVGATFDDPADRHDVSCQGTVGP